MRLVLYSLHGHLLILIIANQIASVYILFSSIIIVTPCKDFKIGIGKFLQLQGKLNYSKAVLLKLSTEY